MALIDVPGATKFCMDKTEVSRAQYDEFVKSGTTPAAKHSECANNLERAPVERCLALENPCAGESCSSRPQVCIDYCDAEAYCSWAGKTLCGTDDGKELTKPLLQTEWNVVWQRACRGLTSSTDKGTKFPYGNEFRPSVCNTSEREGTGCNKSSKTCTPLPVGTLPECKGAGPYSETLDLMGNVAEFIYSVVPSELDGRGLAQFAGSDYLSFDDKGPLECGYSKGSAGLRLDEPTEFIGFRCCKVPN